MTLPQQTGQTPQTPQMQKNTGTPHDRYYHEVKSEACERIRELFNRNKTDIGEVIHKTKVETSDDIEVLLAHVLDHGNPMEISHMIRYATAWWQACHELHEHKEG